MKFATFLCFALLGLAACQENASQPTNPLKNTEWQLLGYGNATGKLIDSMPNNETHTITVTFEQDTVLANLAKNHFRCNYRVISDTLLTISNLIVTEMAGSPWEQKFIDKFPYDTCRYILTVDYLVLFPMSTNYWGEVRDSQPSIYQKID